MNKQFLLFALILVLPAVALAGLKRERLIIDLNGGTQAGEDAGTSGYNSSTSDPVLLEIHADEVVNLPDESVVQPAAEYVGVYSEGAGLGFLPGVKVQQRNRGPGPSPLLADMAVIMGPQPVTFRLDLPEGKYRVTTYHHDQRWQSVGRLNLEVDGQNVGGLEKTSHGKAPQNDTVGRVTFENVVKDGLPLEITFILSPDERPGNLSFPINGIYVEPLP